MFESRRDFSSETKSARRISRQLYFQRFVFRTLLRSSFFAESMTLVSTLQRIVHACSVPSKSPADDTQDSLSGRRAEFCSDLEPRGLEEATGESAACGTSVGLVETFRIPVAGVGAASLWARPRGI